MKINRAVILIAFLYSGCTSVDPSEIRKLRNEPTKHLYNSATDSFDKATGQADIGETESYKYMYDRTASSHTFPYDIFMNNAKTVCEHNGGIVNISSATNKILAANPSVAYRNSIISITLGDCIKDQNSIKFSYMISHYPNHIGVTTLIEPKMPIPIQNNSVIYKDLSNLLDCIMLSPLPSALVGTCLNNKQ